MPELPEVETIVQDLREAGIIGQTITKVNIQRPKNIHNVSEKEFEKKVVGSTLNDIDRRGKYIKFTLSSKFLILHLRMTGKLLYLENSRTMDKHDLVKFTFSNGIKIYYNDVRRFGRFYLVEDPETILGKLGPEPLEDTWESGTFIKTLNNRSRMIKSMLLDQSFLAGLGNIYVDEALWEAKIHPEHKSDSIPKHKQKALYNSIKKVLKKGIKNRGTSLGDGLGNYSTVENERGNNQNFLKVYQKEGQECPRCGDIIKKMEVSQRGTHICPSCQE